MIKFTQALELLRQGKTLKRQSWEGTGIVSLTLEHGEFYYQNPNGVKHFTPVLTTSEILADDWLVNTAIV